jgi:secreted trypsin-like serine protease
VTPDVPDEPRWLEHPDAIIGGEDVPPGDLLCVCAVGQRDRGHIAWHGSGVAVGPRAVLTAAHVVDDDLVVWFGPGTAPATPTADVLPVEAHVLHPDHDPRQHRSDLALLWLGRPHDREPAALAVYNPVPGRDVVRIAGFGYADLEETTGLGRLRSAKVPVVWDRGLGPRPTWPGAVGFVFEDEWVAGRPGLGRDSAGGDSGGPAFLENSGQRVLAGITSRAATSGQAGGGVYVDVSSNAEWIRRTMGRGP